MSTYRHGNGKMTLRKLHLPAVTTPKANVLTYDQALDKRQILVRPVASIELTAC